VVILAMFSQFMRRNIYLGASSKNLDISIRFLDPDFFIGSEISGISGRLSYFYFWFILCTDVENIPRD